jgi:hypothetical protein
MKKRQFLLIAIVISLLAAFPACVPKTSGEDKSQKIDQINSFSYSFPLSLFYELRHCVKLAYNWLILNQQQDGSWQADSLKTAFVLYALVESPGYLQTAGLEEATGKGFKYLKRFVKEDGGVYQTGSRYYTSAAALIAFATTNKPESRLMITKAKDFLIQAQCDEGENYSEALAAYGGIARDAGQEPDLFSTQLALEAIKRAEEYEKEYNLAFSLHESNYDYQNPATSKHWSKALLFLARYQHGQGEHMGGFGHNNYTCNSESLAGIKSLVYGGLEKDAACLQDAPCLKTSLDWLQKHYTLDDGLDCPDSYSYYLQLAQCLSVLGEHVLFDAAGKVHYWREELAEKLIALQNEDGYWCEKQSENEKELMTAYVIIALKFTLKGLNIRDIH